jgi:hypothetical protein
LDKNFFDEGTDLYIKHFQFTGKEVAIPIIEFFASSKKSERQKYDSELEDFWTQGIMAAEVNSEVLLKCVSTSHAADMVIKTMPASSRP